MPAFKEDQIRQGLQLCVVSLHCLEVTVATG